MASIKELLARQLLLKPVSTTPQLDCELLLSDCLGQSRAALFAWPEREVPAVQEQRYSELLKRRMAGEPVAYLLGMREFWSLELEVSPATLIPRPETELLVELALEYLPGESTAQVLDLGTGTGAIALALASERPVWNLLGVDRIQEAVNLAERNRHRLNLNNVQFVHGDWFAGLGGRRFDMIVSNPPYIDSQDPHLGKGDVQFEPRTALVAADNGFGDLMKIIGGATRYLQSGGWLIVEHGMQQGDEVVRLFHQQGFRNVQCHRDLAGLDRATVGRSGNHDEGKSL